VFRSVVGGRSSVSARDFQPNDRDAFIGALREQTAALKEALTGNSKKPALQSTIRVNPTIVWPKLTDEGRTRVRLKSSLISLKRTAALRTTGAA
jgi:hypothetical protein